MPKPIRLSRSSIDLFLECPCCFYRKFIHKISRPDKARYSLNLEIDKLLKQEFDHYRRLQSQHPLQIEYQLPHFPAQNNNLDTWRHNFTGVQHHDQEFLLFGSIDDLWFNPKKGEYSVVDYKATSSQYPPSQTRLESYSRQLSFYSWLLSCNGLQMSDQNYILLFNAYNSDENLHLDHSLQLSSSLIRINNDGSWIEEVLDNIRSCLASVSAPEPYEDCIYCQYLQKVDNQNQAVTLPF